jgi:folate-binding protein YgfZ
MFHAGDRLRIEDLRRYFESRFDLPGNANTHRQQREAFFCGPETPCCCASQSQDARSGDAAAEYRAAYWFEPPWSGPDLEPAVDQLGERAGRLLYGVRSLHEDTPTEALAMSISPTDAGYIALHTGAAWRDLSGRGKIRATGEDRARLLHAMTTQHVQQLTPGQGCYAFFLNAQGRILGDVNLFCAEDHFLLDTEPETREKLFEHLDRYIIADDVTLEDITGELATVSIEGPNAEAVLAKLGAPVPQSKYETASWGDRTIARVDSTGAGGFFIFLPAGETRNLAAALASSGAIEASPEAARVTRIENGRPRYGEEITERYLVQETDQLHAVHFNKGCYLGQEIVERVRSRAQIHRVLRRLEMDTSSPPAPGTRLKSGDTDAAEIVSSAFSPRLSRTVAMAYVRVAFARAGTEIGSGDLRARVT